MPAHELDVTLPWLIRLRWLSLVGQAVAVAVAWYLHLIRFPGLVALALALGAVSNVILWTRRELRGRRPERLMGSVLILDVALLTMLVAGSGGATNPFTVLYLVHITLSAIALSARWTLAIAVISVGGFGTLFLLPQPAAAAHAHAMHGHGAGPGFDHHLQGMWIAFVLATCLTTYFVVRITRAVALQREQIASLREASARSARLAALTTLAAGAAHELGSPLGTIAVAAHEASLGLRGRVGCEAAAADLRLIELEVERCQDILSQMASRVTQDLGGASRLRGEELALRVRDALGERAGRVEVALDGDAELPPVPAEQLVQSIVALVKNALDASDRDAQVGLELVERADGVDITIVDRGAGIDADVLTRIGDPFFTTKQPGQGLGLGVFLARAFAESRGGTLTLESTPGAGTRASVRLPRGPAGVPR